ncbi:hypothetical protein [Roseateles sp.]|uniref:hypothetical protein n=1 Tax=Roseateles sp. TaxID=1971397 RepID=UPI003944443A
MANKGERGNKMSKKPKKDSDSGSSKAAGSDRPVAPVTAVMPKGKEAKKLK